MTQSQGTPYHSAGDILVGRFKLLRPLGKGAMGDVWLAEDAALEGDLVACKLVAGPLARGPRAIACLKREVLLTRRLRHPNILAVYSFWESGGGSGTADVSFITMEYVGCRSLDELLRERGEPFTPGELIPWLGQICGALSYAHRLGILHRDIKPANILITEDGSVRVCDFGIARTVDDVRNIAGEDDISGTMVFMSPEQLLGEPIDHRSDIYSLAASVYELLSGRPPFAENALAGRIHGLPVEPVSHLPAQINQILLRALERNPKDRFASCGQFYQALSAAAGNTECQTEAKIAPSDAPTVTVERPARRARLGAILIEAGAINAAQLKEALRVQTVRGGSLGKILEQLGYLDDEGLANALESQLRLPRAIFDAISPNGITREFDLENKCAVLDVTDTGAVVAMADPLDFAAINKLEERFGVIQIRVATESEILRALNAGREKDHKDLKAAREGE
jgi:hypothetical protein